MNISGKVNFNEKIKKEIAAFLNNSHTGYIYLGVDDRTRTIIKRIPEQEKHQIEETISHWLSSSLYFPSPVGLVTVHTDNDPLCIEIRPGSNQPYSLDDRFYVRNNSESVRASTERVFKMLATRKLDTYDRTKSANQKLTFNYLESQFNQHNLEFKPEALGFYTNQTHDFTNVAFLMSDQNTYSVKIAVFDGLTVTQFKDRKEIVAPIPKQIDDVLSFLNLVNPLATQITGRAQHSEQHGYPPVAIREALLNALSHRSYFSRGPVQIEVFDNRLTILSPGPLPAGLKLTAVMNGQTMPRNPAVVNLLFRLHYIEDYGTGIRRILDSYQGEKRQPTFDAQEDFVKVTLPNRNYASKDNNPIVTKSAKQNIILSNEQKKIITYLQAHRSITRSEVESLLNVKRSQASEYLKQLTEANVIQQVGAGPKISYQLMNG